MKPWASSGYGIFWIKKLVVSKRADYLLQVFEGIEILSSVLFLSKRQGSSTGFIESGLPRRGLTPKNSREGNWKEKRGKTKF